MKTTFLLLCGTILGYCMNMFHPTGSPIHAADGQPHNGLANRPFHYGNPASSYVYRPAASANLLDPVKLTKKEKTQFKGLFDLPKESFTYVVDRLSQDELNRLITYGITQIRLHPKKAGRYAYRISVCQSLNNSVAEESDPVPNAPNPALYMPRNKSLQGIVVGGSLVDYLPGSTFIPYRSLFKLIGSLLIALYYIITGLCCLLVAGFLGYYLLQSPWQQSVSITMSPRPGDFFSAPNTVDNLISPLERIP